MGATKQHPANIDNKVHKIPNIITFVIKLEAKINPE